MTWTNAGFKIKGDNDLEEIIMGFILGEEVVSTVGIPKEETSLIEGVRIAEVLKNSMADKAGLKDNDLILQVDGKDILSKDHIVDLVSSRNPGDLVRIKVRRETLTATSTSNFTLTRDIGTAILQPLSRPGLHLQAAIGRPHLRQSLDDRPRQTGLGTSL